MRQRTHPVDGVLPPSGTWLSAAAAGPEYQTSDDICGGCTYPKGTLLTDKPHAIDASHFTRQTRFISHLSTHSNRSDAPHDCYAMIVIIFPLSLKHLIPYPNPKACPLDPTSYSSGLYLLSCDSSVATWVAIIFVWQYRQCWHNIIVRWMRYLTRQWRQNSSAVSLKWCCKFTGL